MSDIKENIKNAFNKLTVISDDIKKREDDLVSSVDPNENFIKDKDLWYVGGTQDCYAYYNKADGCWIFSRKRALQDRFPEYLDKDSMTSLIFSLSNKNRCVDKMGYYYGNVPTGVLNLMRDTNKVDWVVSDTYHKFFDYLFDSLSNGRITERQSIERSILYKWLHPETTQVPALVFSGCGGAGKNLLSQYMVPFLFHSKHIKPLDKTIFTKSFKGGLEGKMVICIDELCQDYDSFEVIKSWIGSDSLLIEKKFKDEFESMISPLFIFTGNTTNNPKKCAVRIVDDGASGVSRRFSIYKCDTTLVDLIKSKENFTSEEKTRGFIDRCKSNVLLNEIELGKWLYCMLEKYKDQLDEAPIAFHGEDFEFYTNGEDAVLTAVFKRLFIDDAALVVSTTGLYEIYKGHYKETKNNLKWMMERDTIIERIEGLMEKYKLPYKRDNKIYVNVEEIIESRETKKKVTFRSGWKRADITWGSKPKDGADDYFDYDKFLNKNVYRIGSIDTYKEMELKETQVKEEKKLGNSDSLVIRLKDQVKNKYRE
jgi:hypothetical protein